MKIEYKITALVLATLMLSACGKATDLHYLDTTTPAPTETFTPEVFPYTPSDDGVVYGNPKNSTDVLQYQDGYLYFLLRGGTDSRSAELVRFNCENGNVTAVCPDPLCDHVDADCPFYGLGGGTGGFVIGEDGNVYFESLIWGEQGIDASLRKFDVQSGKTTVLEVYGDGWGRSNELYTEDYCFTMGGYWDEAGEVYTNCIMRRDLHTGENKPLFEINLEMAVDYSYSHNLLFIVGDRLYLSDLTSVYSVNFDGGDRRVHFDGRGDWRSMTDGTYMYYCDARGELCRRALDGSGTEERLGVYPYEKTVYMTENYIYYRAGEDVVLGKARIKGYASDTVTLEAGELRRCDHDGGNDTLIYTFAGETADIRPIHALVAGNYFYCTYLWWDDPDGDGIYRDGANQYSWATNGKTDCDILRIDLTTGETYTIHAE